MKKILIYQQRTLHNHHHKRNYNKFQHYYRNNEGVVEVFNESNTYDLSDTYNDCVCLKNNCGCCEYVKIEKINIDDFG